ncbi:CcoQ/FixQ family Cbb3-type cytochrome c oxidase assembly chaperone (plasmid) [Sinorhizobium meliloti]|nr:CcoQ/FixQ family Cbb3-type cytochrome c oxidase assembly chaperone [Sinorhizobium meliloti]
MTTPPVIAERRQHGKRTRHAPFRHSWGLLAMTLFFLGVVLFIFPARRQKSAAQAFAIPLKED